MARGLAAFDRRQIGLATCLIGIDEAGRGCLAGPVMAAAVRFTADFYATSWCRRHSPMVDDSKRLTAAQRAAVVDRFAEAIERGWLHVAVGEASVEEIERHNIYHANTLAMKRALQQVHPDCVDPLWETVSDAPSTPSPAVMEARVLIDGRPIRTFPHPHTAVVKGDQRSLAIALAGIHAKEARDACLRLLDARHPAYGFADHKGYGTPQHLEALRRHGPCRHHRPSFLRGILPGHAGSPGGPTPAGLPPGAAPSFSQDSLFSGD